MHCIILFITASAVSVAKQLWPPFLSAKCSKVKKHILP